MPAILSFGFHGPKHSARHTAGTAYTVFLAESRQPQLARNHLWDSRCPFPLIGSGLGSNAAWYGGFPCALSPAERLMHSTANLDARCFAWTGGTGLDASPRLFSSECQRSSGGPCPVRRSSPIDATPISSLVQRVRPSWCVHSGVQPERVRDQAQQDGRVHLSLSEE
jgi:hypothetical protein